MSAARPGIDDARKMAVFRTMAQAWHDQDWTTCAALFAPEGILHSVMLEPVVGRQAIHDRISRLGGANKKVTLNIERMGVVDGALIVQRVDVIVIDGRRGECPAVGVIEFEGDRIARWRDYYDRSTLARAAGHSTEGQAS
ncbi:MAG: nuclear transport factor 2 family protein [Variovorax sp.]|nr:nuclear transport factor 2 family protein [Variovorax sp.]